MDDLAWDLGDPDGDVVTPNPNPFQDNRTGNPFHPIEGSNDHAKPARHGQRRADALARGSHGRKCQPSG